ncbi:MAG: six-cysteine ranthipeptide SCIFF [Oscillospiraceae bacterium]|nr:six-cysteine ranthipeptide SCIFF [Oscillospiraceae bacterium]
MKHVKILVNSKINNCSDSGCGECQASCQSAAKTSCSVANQKCEQKKSEEA